MNVAPDFRGELLAMIPSLRAFSMSLCGKADRADDLVQETLIKAWTNHARFEPGTNMRAWLFTILRNQYYSELRKRRREVEDADGSLSGNLAVQPGQHGHMDMQNFLSALQQIPEDQREALVLVGASGFTYAEAAEIIGVATGTAKSRVSRARARLAEILKIGDEADYGSDTATEAVLANLAVGC
jgi:RNA polymerase sigma-70 factor (ECF subfamily)